MTRLDKRAYSNKRKTFGKQKSNSKENSVLKKNLADFERRCEGKNKTRKIG